MGVCVYNHVCVSIIHSKVSFFSLYFTQVGKVYTSLKRLVEVSLRYVIRSSSVKKRMVWQALLTLAEVYVLADIYGAEKVNGY